MTPALLPLLAGLLAPAPGRLVVRSPHYGAVVLVDREPVGRIPLAPLALPAGLHLIEATAPGRSRWGRLVFVVPGRDVELAVRWQAPAAAGSAQSRPGAPQATADRAPTRQPPRIELTGAAGVVSGWLGDTHDTDLRLRWRLAGTQLGDGHGAAVVAGRALNDLAGADRLWRRVQPDNDTALRLDEAWVGWARDDQRLAVGRLARSGPAGHAYLLDGASTATAIGAWTLEVAGGRRAVQWGPRPHTPALASARIDRRFHRTVITAAHLWHDRAHHSDVRFGWRQGPLQVRATGRLVDGRGAQATATAALDRAAQRIWIRAEVDAARPSPFEWRLAPLGAFGLTPLRQRVLRWGLSQTWTRWGLEADGAVRADGGGGWRQHDGALLGTWRHRSLRLITGCRVRLSSGHGIAAYDAVRPLAGGSVRGRWGRLNAEGGATWMRLPGMGQATGRWLPHAGVQARLRLARALSLVGAFEARAVHPSWYPEGETMHTLRLGVELR